MAEVCDVGSPELEEAKRAWGADYAGLRQDEIDRRVLAFSTLVQEIARSGAVSPDEFASKLGIETSQAHDIFAGLARTGLQSDEQGNIVGVALTSRPTPHRVRLGGKMGGETGGEIGGERGGKELYAWCSLDTLFIPGLLGEDAEISSTCPVSGDPIRLRVTPAGVQNFSPADAVVSIVLPNVGQDSAHTGPASPT